jgi:hypothetical protein
MRAGPDAGQLDNTQSLQRSRHWCTDLSSAMTPLTMG